ncbi:MAG: transposase [Paludibacteraceae bacterium]|nr:transposase [Paludibacteraceae bacterium]
MIFKEDISSQKAEELFADSEKVMKFVADVKWENGFECRSCGHTNYCDGKTPHSRRCTRCKKEESATAHTIFHNIKFPLHKAFFIAYNVCVLGNEFSSYNFSDKLGLNQMTCWKFRKRIHNCMLNSDKKSKSKIEAVMMAEFR